MTLKAHYLAVCKSEDGMFFLSNSFYSSEQEAREDLGGVFVRLAREIPPLNLEVTPIDQKPQWKKTWRNFKNG